MVFLKQSLTDWGTEQFVNSFKQEVESLKNGDLPLAEGASISGYVDDSNLAVTLKSQCQTDKAIIIEFGIFFEEIIAGCSCGDDSPTENSYCEMCVAIDKHSGEAVFKLIKTD
jgi:hypothetical protein